MSELAVIDNAPALDIPAWGEALVFATRMSQAVSDTEFVPAPLRGRPEAVTALIMYGMEIGVTPMQALQGMHIVDGRPSPSSELMRALIYRAGHTVTIHEATGTRCRVSGLRKGRPESERYPVEWNIDMARSAGLLGKKNWNTYPRAMLVARATGDLARALFPDVIKGLGYVAEDDTEADAGWGAPAAEPEPAVRPALQRKRRVKAVEEVPLPPMPVEDEAQPPLPPPHILHPEAEPKPPAPVSLPDPEPERPTPEPDTPPAPGSGSGPVLLGAAPMRALQAGLTRELGTVATREERHALLAAILGRDVDTSKTLTRAEGLRVLDVLGQFESGAMSFDLDLTAPEGNPAFIITDARPEPDAE